MIKWKLFLATEKWYGKLRKALVLESGDLVLPL